MTLAEPTLLSLVRALLIAAFTLVLMLAAGPGIRAVRGDFRRVLFWGAMAALFVPGFFTGFVLFQKSGGSEMPMMREARYFMLVWSRYASLALLAVWLSPPSLSSEAMHCLRLGGAPSWRRRIVWELRSWGRGLWLGIGIVFLLAFQEFELATTWNLRAWTVAIFDAQVGGLAFDETLRLALPPLAVQIAIGAALVLGARGGQAASSGAGTFTRRSWIGMLPLLAALLLGALLPLAMFAAGARAMLSVDAPGSLVPLREIGSGVLLSACATTGAWWLAGWAAHRGGARLLLAVPGLFGALPCGLLVLTLLQIAPLRILRDSALPAIAALVLVLLPFALLLRTGIGLARDAAALHVARESGARQALWLEEGWPRLCALLLLFCLGYGDFTINALLAPPAFTSAGGRILNLLHYGRSDALATIFTLAFALPLGAAVLTALAARFYPRRRVR